MTLLGCSDCIPCRGHYDGDLPDEHDPAECSCPAATPCLLCRLTEERDEARGKLAKLSGELDEVQGRLLREAGQLRAALVALIGRTGYCAVCERRTPFHFVDCPMKDVVA